VIIAEEGLVLWLVAAPTSPAVKLRQCYRIGFVPFEASGSCMIRVDHQPPLNGGTRTNPMCKQSRIKGGVSGKNVHCR
jgi:hypothetical protein